ncbi:MAG: L-seryl-tRNA(Sec) selenium transferase [Vallitalea sp.]|jgi:L-seryl-tRNA(Ser) seleniumtransferase|nr:L-seryl-tRNA(Sec) selenium transferase [Vallitalea sp.]
MNNMLRNIPSINEFFDDERINELVNIIGRKVTKDIVVSCTSQYRDNMIIENYRDMDISKEDIKEVIIDNIIIRSKLNERKRIHKVINGTGVVLHTNMGRAPLPKIALDEIVNIADGYCNLEYDLITGKRGSRYESIEDLLVKLTGAESAIVVNNNAAAVFLCLNTLAYNKEVVISRSEQVEIGGSFRVPEIIERSNAKMVEVGTTNKTYVRDYENAITQDTKVLLKVHKSNYKIEGFTCEVQGEELVELARENKIITMEDLGSGVLVDLEEFSLPYEPTVMDLVKKDIDIITFSGDKLLGGPQAGIIVGKKELIDKIKKNPLTRMVRIDKLSLIALQEVLNIYLTNDNITNNIPILNMLTKDKESLLSEANVLRKSLIDTFNDNLHVKIIDEEDTTGGGSLPGVIIKGVSLSITSKELSPQIMQKRLREYKTPIICKVKDNEIIISMRTINKKEYNDIIDGFYYVLGKE